LLTCLEADLSL